MRKRRATYEQHADRLNRVLQHIDDHLHERLTVQDLADIAGYSKYYFHHMFLSMNGDNVTSYIQRLRLQRACRLLQYRPDWTITDIAWACGYHSLVNFSRMFQLKLGITPSDYRRRSESSKPDEEKVRQLRGLFPIEIVSLPSVHAAYYRYHYGLNPVQPDPGIRAAYRIVEEWLEERGSPCDTYIGVLPDNPFIIPPELCRYDACIACDPAIRGEGIVSTRFIPGGLYAAAHVKTAHFQTYWEFTRYMTTAWLKNSKYEFDYRRASLERYAYRGNDDPHYTLDYCIPIALRYSK